MKEILTVSQLNENIKAILEESFGTLWVEGEVSNLRRPQSGHVYFTLKDDKSQIRAVYFRSFGARAVRFDLEDGMKIICRARLTAYVPRGEYQLIVETVEPQGTGALQKAFEQLKAKLAAEGLFDASRKKPLPFLPARIGVVTSPSGAVIRDILNVTRRRFPAVNILIAPTRVQGAEAAAEIIAALARLQRVGGIEVIIIARGGGSLEDLAPFNDEALARAVAQSAIPVVSAVGHETDFTICDFVADLRAPTPSAAAELVVPEQADLRAAVDLLAERLAAAQRRLFDAKRARLDALEARFRDPRRYLQDFSLRVDDLHERLGRAWTQKIAALRNRLGRLELGLLHQNPQQRLRERTLLLGSLEKALLASWQRIAGDRRTRLQKNAALLSSLNPLAVLSRGYSITRRLPEGTIVRDAGELTEGLPIQIQLARGGARARVEKIREE
ncbi:MAG: exodeoxyribonuclease VII large subunit [Smithellaceae bacterium]|nr:exodeoxyribonuclease VII large subunit [Syntrophaceae bacterium]MDD4241711.1 exodeoxyribonuclease VII large subunit [Smithellaceae bacterium]